MLRINGFNATRFVGIIAFTVVLCFISLVSWAEKSTQDPIEFLIKFDALGQFKAFDPATGEITYTISADGVAPKVKRDGRITPRNEKEHREERGNVEKDENDEYKVTISAADITFDPFDPMNPPPVVNFSCVGCNLTFSDGSNFESDPNLPLNGRAFFLYGPVAPNPLSSVTSIRMAGCAGLRETSGVGAYAGKVGSICFNGEFNFDMSDPTSIPASLTGSSSCTIVLHTPVSLPTM